MILAAAFLVVIGAALGYERLRTRKAATDRGGGELFSVAMLLLMEHKIAQTAGQAALLGACFALAYAGFMLWKLRLAVPISAMLTLSQLTVWTLFSLGAWKLFALPFPLSVGAIACLGTALFYLEWTLLPLWGTAQNFACSSPLGHSFIALFGAAGGTWVTLCYSSFYAQFLYTYHISVAMIPLLLWFAGFFALVQILGSLLFRNTPKTLRVATFGWAGSELDALAEIPPEFQKAASEASALQARLLVTPEAAIHVQDRAHFRVAICTLAQRYNIALAIGYFDQKENRNCIDFVSASGEVVGCYVKTHLVPIFERYTRGTGEIALMEVDGVKVGGVICQDDNFPDIARRYARAGTQLLVVPTNDWKKVKDIHFANHLWRGLEFRFALARATSDGISALTSAQGRVQKSSDHFQEGPKLLVADVQVGTGKPTLYARTGDWFPIACGIVAVGALIWAR